MNCNLNTNNTNLSFGRILCVSGGKQFIEKNLNKAERAELQKLIKSQENNPIDITLAEYNDKRICGWTAFTEQTNGKLHRKDYTQRILFESPLDFIKRLCDIANSLQKKFQGDIEENNVKDFELHI